MTSSPQIVSKERHTYPIRYVKIEVMSTKKNTNYSQNLKAQQTANKHDKVLDVDSAEKTFALATFQVIALIITFLPSRIS